MIIHCPSAPHFLHLSIIYTNARKHKITNGPKIKSIRMHKLRFIKIKCTQIMSTLIQTVIHNILWVDVRYRSFWLMCRTAQPLIPFSKFNENNLATERAKARENIFICTPLIQTQSRVNIEFISIRIDKNTMNSCVYWSMLYTNTHPKWMLNCFGFHLQWWIHAIHWIYFDKFDIKYTHTQIHIYISNARDFLNSFHLLFCTWEYKLSAFK